MKSAKTLSYFTQAARPPLALGLLCGLCLALSPSLATAQDGTSDAFTSLPMTRYREAHAAMARGDWLGAREVLLELWNRSRSYDVAASLAQVEHALGNDVAAALHLTFAIAHLAPKERPETLTRYLAALGELETQIGRVQVNASEAGAEIRVDGTRFGVSPLTSAIFVEPGEHTIEARRRGSVVSKRIEVGKGALAVVGLSLPPAEDVGASAAPSTSASTSSLAASRALTTSPEIRAAHGSRSAIPLYVGAGATLLGAGMGVGFGLASNSDEEKANTLRARLGPTGCSTGTASRSACDAANRAVEAQRRDATLSTIGIGVASAGAIATLGYWLFWPKSKPSAARLSVRPSGELTANEGRLRLVGEF